MQIHAEIFKIFTIGILWWKGEHYDDLESEDKRLETENTIDNRVPCRKLAYHRWKLSNTH